MCFPGTAVLKSTDPPSIDNHVLFKFSQDFDRVRVLFNENWINKDGIKDIHKNSFSFFVTNISAHKHQN